jgi:hypothetical protein
MLTLSLLNPHSPGLQMRVARGGCGGGGGAGSAELPGGEWDDVEERGWASAEQHNSDVGDRVEQDDPQQQHASSESERAGACPCEGTGADDCLLLVHVGDFVSTLTKGYYPAASHRVVRARGLAAPARVSMPFLVRPRPECEVDTRTLEPGVGENERRLLQLHGVTCAQLRRFFDARGGRLHTRKLEGERQDAERRRLGQEFRDKLRAERAARAAGGGVGVAPGGSDAAPSDSATDSESG